MISEFEAILVLQNEFQENQSFFFFFFWLFKTVFLSIASPGCPGTWSVDQVKVCATAA